MGEEDTKIWDGMLSHLRDHHPMICRAWFHELEPLGVYGGALNLRAQTPFHRDYLRKSCSESFNDAARSVTGQFLTVRFLGPDEAPQGPKAKPVMPARKEPTSPARASSPAAPSNGAVPKSPPPVGSASLAANERPAPSPRPDALTINPDNCFENFVVGQGNRLAHAAARSIAERQGKYNPFFIYGGVGLGKTHLLQATCLELVRTDPTLHLYYVSCEGFVTQFLDSVRDGLMADFRHRFRDVDVLVIDDIHFLAKRDSTQEEFFHTFNSLFQSQKQIILSSDAPPEEIPDLEQRLVSRFKWGLVAQIEPPTFEVRMEIIKRKAGLRGVVIPDDVVFLIAQKIDTNIRELEGAVIKLQMEASLDGKPIDLALAERAIGGLMVSTSNEPTIQTIMSLVTEFFRVRLTDLQSKRRQRSVALPRQVCMYLARRNTRMSLEEIGGFFGGRDHTTVMHAVKIVEARRLALPDFDGQVKELEERIRPTWRGGTTPGSGSAAAPALA